MYLQLSDFLQGFKKKLLPPKVVTLYRTRNNMYFTHICSCSLCKRTCIPSCAIPVARGFTRVSLYRWSLAYLISSHFFSARSSNSRSPLATQAHNWPLRLTCLRLPIQTRRHSAHLCAPAAARSSCPCRRVALLSSSFPPSSPLPVPLNHSAPVDVQPGQRRRRTTLHI